MPPVSTPQVNKSNNNSDSFEKVFLSLLFFITITQFSTFGYQSVTYILGAIFNVTVISTPLDTVIGLVAMGGSALVFVGAAMQWRKMPSAIKFISIGALLFILKNVFDLINETILFNMENVIVSMGQIQALARILGEQFFQMAFWILVYFYFKHTTKVS
jgi:energy-coupling factor transporter transmembrane protein EcfT